MLPASHAQQKDPHIGYVYPGGGQQGTTFVITIGGQYLDDVTGVRLTGAGIQATVEKHTKAITQKEFNEFKDKLMEVRRRMEESGMKGEILNKRDLFIEIGKEIGLSEDTIKALVAYRKRLADPKRQLNPQLGDTVTIRLQVAADAAVGTREIRLLTSSGASNPLHFFVGNLPEFMPIETDETKEFEPVKRAPITIRSLPMTINGQLLPGHVDDYSFHASKGTHLVIKGMARQLVPYLADAVPGWFQASLVVYDAKGQEVAYAGDYRYDPDPVVLFDVPQDGNYVLEVKDALYRGREDFVYRIIIGELPFVTGIYPLGCQVGSKRTIDLKGWNLPVSVVMTDAWNQSPGIFPVPIESGGVNCNNIPFAFEAFPECMEKEPNDDPTIAQRITLPIVVNGKIDHPGDWDVFCFDGHAGDQVVAEVCARRLNSPLDSILQLTDQTGKQLAINDDYEDKGDGMSTHHADSYLTAKLPGDGFYFVRVGDTTGKGGPDYNYRLRISAPRPDFELRAVPSCVNSRTGGTATVTVYALRRDDFSGDIHLNLKNAPPGVTLTGTNVFIGNNVSTNQDKIQVTLKIPPKIPTGTYPFVLEGLATNSTQELRHVAVPADDLMQAFIYHHLVTAKEQLLAVNDPPRRISPLKLSVTPPVKLQIGATTSLRFNTPNVLEANLIMAELTTPPQGISIANITREEADVIVTIKVDGLKNPIGSKGNLVINSYSERPGPIPAPTTITNTMTTNTMATNAMVTNMLVTNTLATNAVVQSATNTPVPKMRIQLGAVTIPYEIVATPSSQPAMMMNEPKVP